jgi:phosphoribosylaminoimidazole-succinocarboxamide synthase
MSNDWVEIISRRYIELYEHLIGQPFEPRQLSDDETEKRILECLRELKAID